MIFKWHMTRASPRFRFLPGWISSTPYTCIGASAQDGDHVSITWCYHSMLSLVQNNASRLISCPKLYIATILHNYFQNRGQLLSVDICSVQLRLVSLLNSWSPFIHKTFGIFLNPSISQHLSSFRQFPDGPFFTTVCCYWPCQRHKIST